MNIVKVPIDLLDALQLCVSCGNIIADCECVNCKRCGLDVEVCECESCCECQEFKDSCRCLSLDEEM